MGEQLMPPQTEPNIPLWSSLPPINLLLEPSRIRRKFLEGAEFRPTTRAGRGVFRAATIRIDEREENARQRRSRQGQTIARKAMLLADHTAYHIGQLILLRRALGAWKDWSHSASDGTFVR